MMERNNFNQFVKDYSDVVLPELKDKISNGM